MSWIRLAKVLTTAMDVKGAHDTVKGVHDYGKKLKGKDPSKLTWDDVKIFDTQEIKMAMAAAKKEQALAKSAENAKFIMPDPGSKAQFIKAFKALEKFGLESKEYKAAMMAYFAILRKFDTTLDKLQKEVTAVSIDMVDRKGKVKAIKDYAKFLEKVFLNCAKVPMSDSQMATFFVLSQDCARFSAQMPPLEKSYTKIFSHSRSISGNIADTKKLNLEWLKHMEKTAFLPAKKPEAKIKLMSKSIKSVKPVK